LAAGLSLVLFFLQAAIFIGMGLASPPETLEDQIAANKDPSFRKWHFIGHLLTASMLALGSAAVPWAAEPKVTESTIEPTPATTIALEPAPAAKPKVCPPPAAATL
jgi:hypothetical protein